MDPKPEEEIYAFRSTWDSDGRGNPLPKDLLAEYLAKPEAASSIGLILGLPGDGGDMASVTGIVVEASRDLPNIRGLFIGDMTSEENELSWIHQSEMKPVLDAFPGLETLWIRGGSDLSFSPVRHIGLKKLVIETGGLPRTVLTGLAESIFPELEHLELWLGEENYGWNGTVEDIRPLLYNGLFPKLKYLGLRNSEIQDAVALLAADAPVLDHLDTLDLSLGTLRAEGAEALLRSERVQKLKKLDLHHHYLTPATMSQFASLGIEVDVNEPETPDAWDDEEQYYISVGE